MGMTTTTQPSKSQVANEATSKTASRGKLIAYLQLLRPANIVTAWADIFAGYSVVLAGYATGYGATELMATADSKPLFYSLLWLLVATTGLYAGGVVFNDVCDAELDAVERPERPIPSGQVPMAAAVGLGVAMLGMGIAAAARVSALSFGLAAAIALNALLYDKFSKHHTFLGPLNMGICRGCNLLLGVSAIASGSVVQSAQAQSSLLTTLLLLSCIPLAYIGAITAISQGEVHGGEKKTGAIALLLLTIVVSILLGLSTFPTISFWPLLPFVLLLSALVFPPFIRAAQDPAADKIRAAVKAGILSLIVLDASIGAGFAGWPYGLATLALLPLSIGVAKLFAVT